MSDAGKRLIAAAKAARIRIQHNWGHGNWHNASKRDELEAKCDDLNEKHPDGNHVVVSEGHS